MKSELVFHASVIIPVFNDRDGLLRILDALGAQTYPISKFEVVVVDNGSEPPVQLEIAYSFHVRVVPCGRAGSYAARNAGAGSAAGQVLAFIDADCIPEPDWLTEGIASLERNHSRSIIGGDVRVLPPEPRTGVGLYQHVVGFQQKRNITVKHFSATANLFCYAEHYRLIGPFDERLLSGGDREWCWRARQIGIELVYAPEAVANTPPRTSLKAAIRQARRVTGGRQGLAQNLELVIPPGGLQAHRVGWQALSWIITHPELSWIERLKVLTAAMVIRSCAVSERLRLSLGSAAERR